MSVLLSILILSSSQGAVMQALADDSALTAFFMDAGTSQSVQTPDPISVAQGDVQPNLFSGSLSYGVPLFAPRGIGPSPQLSLGYDTAAMRANGAFGHGWGVGFSQIRRINKEGVDRMYSDSVYFSQIPGAMGELRMISVDAQEEVYGLRRESSFAKFRYLLASKSWIVQMTNGYQYVLGDSPDSQHTNDIGDLIAGWFVSRVRDLHGNEVQYEYLKNNGVLYPKRVAYGAGSGTVIDDQPFQVRFLPFADGLPSQANRGDEFLDYSLGFSMRYRYVVDEIEVLVSGQKRLSYGLDYLSLPNASRTDLKRVTVRSFGQSQNPTRVYEMSYFHEEDGFLGSQFHRRNLLKSVVIPTGGILDFDYDLAINYRDPGTGLFNERPHYTQVVLKSLSRQDFFGRNDVTEYAYYYSSYYFESSLERTQAGFGKVVVTDPLGQQSVSYFHQGGGYDGVSLGENLNDSWYLIGKPYRSEVYDVQGRKRSENITKVAQVDLGNERRFVYSTDQVSTIFDTSGAKKSTAGRSVYDLSNGSMLESVSFGEVNANADGSFTDLIADNRKIVMEYAENVSQYLFVFPKRTQSFNENDVLTGQMEMIYDDLPFGQVQKGDITEQLVSFLDESRQISVARTYDSAGKVLTSTDALGNMMSISYDASDIYPERVSNALGHTSQFVYDLMFGQPLQTTDSNGMQTELVLDGIGRVLETRITDPDTGSLEQMTATEYLESSFPYGLKGTTFLDGSRQADTYSYLDGFGRTVQSRTQHDGAGNYVVTHSIYDELGRVKEVTLPVIVVGTAFRLADASDITTSSVFDVFGRALSTTDANGTTSTVYDNWVQTMTDAKGNSKTTENDAFGRLIKVIEREAGQDLVTEYQYDSRDLMTQLTDSQGNVRNFVYDSLGRMLSQEDLHNPADTDFGVMLYSYDDNGNVLTMINPKGEVIENQYDDLNRMTRQFRHGQAGSAHDFEYDNLRSGLGYIGQLSKIITPDNEWTGVYDVRGRLISETNTIAGVDYEKSYTYTRFDQPKTTVYPDGTPISSEYDGVGQLEKVKTGSQEIISDLNYSPVMQISEVMYGNNVRSTIGYDAAQMYRMISKSTLKVTTVWNMDWLRIPHFFDVAVAGDWLLAFSSPARNRLKKKMQMKQELSTPAVSQGTLIQPSDQIEALFGDSSSNTQGTVTTNPLLEHLMNDVGGFGFNDPIFDQQTGQIYMPDAPSSPRVKTVGSRGKSVLNFIGDAQGNINEVTGNVSMTATYRNTDVNPPAATGYQVILNKDGRFMWQDSSYIPLVPPLQVGDTTSSLHYDLSHLSDVGSYYSFQMRFQLETGVITPVSDVVNFTLGAAQSTGGQMVVSSSSAPDIELYEVDGVTLVSSSLDIFVGAQPVQDMSLQLSVDHEGPVSALQISFVPPLPVTATGSNVPSISHTPQLNGLGGVNDQVQISWSPTTEQIGNYMMTLSQSDLSGMTSTRDVLVSIQNGTPIVAPAGDVMQQLSYVYDSVGNITQVNEQADTPSQGLKSFVYDDLYRLKQVTEVNAADRYGDYLRTYDYDSVGNILNKSDQGDYSYSQTGKINPHAVTGINNTTSGKTKQYTYDDNGNLVREEITALGNLVTVKIFDWNHYNRMERSEVLKPDGSAIVSTYAYDHSGRRIRKQVEVIPAGMTSGAVKTTVYPFADFELTDIGHTKVSVMAGSMHVGTVEYDGGQLKIYYSHTDHLGGGNILTNEQGGFTQSLDYFPFGSVRVDEQYEGFDERLKFTGHEWDDEIGLYYAQARYYNSDIGRFIGIDPAAREVPEKFLRDPQQMNFYTYVRNHPINAVDPDGLLTVFVHGTDSSPDKFDDNYVQTVTSQMGDTNAIVFDWSVDTFNDSNSHDTRIEASEKLHKLIADYEFSPGETLNIVAHSHGGNVVMDAINTGLDRKVDNLVLMGAPVRDEYSLKNRNDVGNAYNIYSSLDLIQTGGGIGDGENNKRTRDGFENLSVNRGGSWKDWRYIHSRLAEQEIWNKDIAPEFKSSFLQGQNVSQNRDIINIDRESGGLRGDGFERWDDRRDAPNRGA